MVRRPSLSGNALWALAGQVALALGQWGALAALAKGAASKDVGQYALALSVATPAFAFAGMQLRSVMATDAAGRFRFKDYLSLRIAGAAATCALLGCLTFFVPSLRSAGAALAAVAVMKCAEAMSDCAYGLFHRHENLRAVSISQLLKGALAVPVVAVAVNVWPAASTAALAIAGVWVVVLVAFDVPRIVRVLRTERVPEASGGGPMALLVQVLPLGIIVLLLSVTGNVPRYFLEGVHGAAALGVLAALGYFVVAVDLAVGAAHQAAMPSLARAFLDDRPRFRRLTVGLVGVAVAFSGFAFLFVLLLGAPVLRLAYTPEYAEHAEVLAWLMAGCVVAVTAGAVGTALTAARVLWAQLPINLVSLVAITALSALLVPKHGLEGAAWALLGMALVKLVLVTAVWLREGARPSAVGLDEASRESVRTPAGAEGAR